MGSLTIVSSMEFSTRRRLKAILMRVLCVCDDIVICYHYYTPNRYLGIILSIMKGTAMYDK